MNKGQYSSQSQSQLAFKEYMEIAKMYSKEKSPNVRRYSRSPKQSDNQNQRKVETGQYKMLEERYRELEYKYRDLLENVKQRNLDHEKLKAQIKMYQKNHERDTQEIERLRCIIGLIKKRSVSIQVSEDQLDQSNGARASRLNKFDQSTQDEIKLKTSAEKINSRERLSPYSNLIRKKEEKLNWETVNKDCTQGIYLKNRTKYNLNNTENAANSTKYSRQIKESYIESKKLSNSPYSKLRYVPGTSFK